MKNELHQAYEHLLVIRGTHYGLLAEEEYQLVCDLYRLDEDDRDRLREMLKMPGEPLTCDQLAKLMGQETPPPDPMPHTRLRQLLHRGHPTELRLLWMREIVDDEEAIGVLRLAQEGCSFQQITSKLQLSTAQVQEAERRILQAYRRAEKEYRATHRTHCRRRPIREFYV